MLFQANLLNEVEVGIQDVIRCLVVEHTDEQGDDTTLYPDYTYGIYVTGDLPIGNEDIVESSLTVGQKNNTSATRESAAIYCGGKLTVQ